MAICTICGVTILEGQEVVLSARDKQSPPAIICKSCEAKAEYGFQQETEDANLSGGLLLGLAAGLAGGLIWYGFVVLTGYEVAIVAIVIGFLVGQAVFIGAGRKRGLYLQVLSVSITLTAMLMSEYLIMRHVLVLALAERGITNIPVLLPPGLVIEILVEAIKASPISLLFWGLAIWQAFVIPGKRKPRRSLMQPGFRLY